MPDAESFVAAIAAAPADDLPRLVFADWLDENGDPARAEFIRDHVRLAKVFPGTDEYKTLFRKCADTLKANLPAWIKPACDAFGQPTEWSPGRTPPPDFAVILQTGYPPYPLHGPVFARGFIDRVYLQLLHVRAADQIDRYFRHHPTTRLSLQLPYGPEQWRRVATAAFGMVRMLEVVPPMNEATAHEVFGSSVWVGVRRVRLNAPDVVEAFCRSPLARRISHLRTPTAAAIVRGLNEFPLDDQLQEYGLMPWHSTYQATPEDWSALSRVSFRPTLKRLDLTRCGMTDDGLAAFARGEEWVRLQGLKLGGNLFGDRGWADFCRGWRTPELTYLDASRNRLTDAGGEMLARSGMLKTLRVIDLRGNRITGRGAVALARAVAEGTVKRLLLAGNPVGKREAATVKGLLGERSDLANGAT